MTKRRWLAAAIAESKKPQPTPAFARGARSDRKVVPALRASA
ncbi:hypothetical protein SAMN04488012_103338 [Palleronia salina]|uniref:Uncharacterized protein n=1 Tax=Palleronia salina TaxID=313368 RepID=A0A1M6F518_9RHOB|nr:hypothetical protein [Palleronia salina]SHI92763.1 hypothetical protein SAMN04488012_103338 [Palleronia salina]